ncbi:hypothetical protein DAPPUDRAFT_253960 [Daphnia pulex]|uniref:Uncharacterized protein n=1 Tax=Daphnia pulex TaxID=6669 RepID=E9H614_DAPPU|nr:hypothetical protein DAPPUDRAFT_253960 [Daphnia pulex]|eukprot:EFX72836.1 hypothetical protein DAPPUDRAFT_253960 [Daphnia pulex]
MNVWFLQMYKGYRGHGYSYGRSTITVGQASSIGYLGGDNEEECSNSRFNRRRGERLAAAAIPTLSNNARFPPTTSPIRAPVAAPIPAPTVALIQAPIAAPISAPVAAPIRAPTAVIGLAATAGRGRALAAAAGNDAAAAPIRAPVAAPIRAPTAVIGLAATAGRGRALAAAAGNDAAAAPITAPVAAPLRAPTAVIGFAAPAGRGRALAAAAGYAAAAAPGNDAAAAPEIADPAAHLRPRPGGKECCYSFVANFYAHNNQVAENKRQCATIFINHLIVTGAMTIDDQKGEKFDCQQPEGCKCVKGPLHSPQCPYKIAVYAEKIATRKQEALNLAYLEFAEKLFAAGLIPADRA